MLAIRSDILGLFPDIKKKWIENYLTKTQITALSGQLLIMMHVKAKISKRQDFLLCSLFFPILILFFLTLYIFPTPLNKHFLCLLLLPFVFSAALLPSNDPNDEKMSERVTCPSL